MRGPFFLLEVDDDILLAMKRDGIESRISEIETLMNRSDFWADKRKAQEVIEEYNILKDELSGFGKYDKGSAIITLFAGAGGQDSEDFVAMLFSMYSKYIEKEGWSMKIIHSHETDHGGYRNITVEIEGRGAYGRLKRESGVHRLVRLSPFNANNKRHTSFAMVEVIPRMEDAKAVDINEGDLKIEFSKSSGPGGQNVNKRETAVRIVHIPTGIAVHSDSERLQERNKEKALEILRGKLYHKEEEDKKRESSGMAVSKTVSNEWGSQIRSYVLHPYKLVKDHRSSLEVRDVERVLDGFIDDFLDDGQGHSSGEQAVR